MKISVPLYNVGWITFGAVILFFDSSLANTENSKQFRNSILRPNSSTKKQGWDVNSSDVLETPRLSLTFFTYTYNILMSLGSCGVNVNAQMNGENVKRCKTVFWTVFIMSQQELCTYALVRDCWGYLWKNQI